MLNCYFIFKLKRKPRQVGISTFSQNRDYLNCLHAADISELRNNITRCQQPCHNKI